MKITMDEAKAAKAKVLKDWKTGAWTSVGIGMADGEYCVSVGLLEDKLQPPYYVDGVQVTFHYTGPITLA